MKHSYIDEYSGIDSPIHSLEPRIKIISLFAFILFVISTPLEGLQNNNFTAFGFYALFIIILIVSSGIPVFFFLRRSLAVFPFVLVIAAFIPFAKGNFSAVKYPLLGLGSSVRSWGLLIFFQIVIRAYLTILSLILLTASTDFSTLLKAFEKLKVPGIFIMIVSFAYRYIFVFLDELMKMRQAKEARSVSGFRLFHLRVLANMLGVLFIRAYERAEKVYLAMCARGFDGQIRIISDFKIKPGDILFLSAVLAVLITIRLGAI